MTPTKSQSLTLSPKPYNLYKPNKNKKSSTFKALYLKEFRSQIQWTVASIAFLFSLSL